MITSKFQKEMLHLIPKIVYKKIRYTLNKRGDTKCCYVCKQTFNHFTQYRGGSKNIPVFLKKLEFVGSDIDNFGCMYCGSTDRERHLFMYFDEINFWSKIKNSNVIHFAPEKNLSRKIEQCSPLSYIKADLYPADNSIQKIDLTKIPFNDEVFDVLICNHVLEHVNEYMKGLTEIFRVLKKNGVAILQTPYSKVLQKNFEDEGINTNELRLLYYGQEDHVRCFSEKHFFQNLVDTGFNLQLMKHNYIFDEDLSKRHGVNDREDLIRVIKPN